MQFSLLQNGRRNLGSLKNEHKKSYIPNKITLLMNPQGSTHLLIEWGNLNLAVWLISSNEWKQREYLKRLKSSSQMPEELLHKLVTNRPGISGLVGVHRDKLILFDAL